MEIAIMSSGPDPTANTTPLASSSSTAAPLRRRRRWPKILLGLVALLLLIVALLPLAAGQFAPSFIESALAKSINGTAKIQGLSLGYFSGQRIGPVIVSDDKGQKIGELNVNVSRGLLGLGKIALGSADLGTIDISGQLNLNIDQDGKTTLDRLLKPATPSTQPSSTPPPSGPAAPAEPIPAITAKLNINALDLNVTDARPGRGSASIKGLKGGGTISTRDPIKLELTATPQATPTGGKTQTGDFKLTADIGSAFDAAGRPSPEQAKVDVKLIAKDIPSALVEVFAGPEAGASALLGEKLDLNLTAAGTLAEADATITFTSAGVNADGAFKYSNTSAGPWVSTIKPFTAKIDGQRALAVPAIASALKQQDQVAIQQMPSINLSLDSMRLRLPGTGEDPAKVDLRGSALALSMTTTAASGTVRVPKDDGSLGDPQPYALAPVTAKLDASDLSKPVKFDLNTSATLGGQPAGTISVNLTTDQLLDDKGAARPMPGSVDGTIAAKEIATAIAQPFVQALGIDLARDLGPTVDLEASAKNQAKAGAAPEPFVNVRVKSKNVQVSGRGRVQDGGKLFTSSDTALSIQITQAGPAFGGILAKAGVQDATGLPVSILAKDLRLDIPKLTQQGDMKTTGPDLRGLAGSLEIATGQASLKVPLGEGRPLSQVNLAGTKTMVDLGKLAAGELTVTSSGAVALDGKPAGAFAFDLAGTKLLNPNGWLDLKDPNKLAAKLSIKGIATALAQPFLKDAGVDLPQDLGPTLDIQFSASNLKQPDQAKLPAIGSELRITSERLSVIAPIDFDGTAIRSAAATQVEYQRPGQLLGRFLKPEGGVRVSPDGWVKVSISDLLVPLEETKTQTGTALAPALGKAIAKAEFSVGGFDITPINASGQPTGEALKLFKLGASASLEPSKTPRIEIAGSMAQGTATSTIEGGFDLEGLLTNGTLTPATARPVGQLAIRDVPTLLAKLIPPGPPTKDAQGNLIQPMDLGSLVQGVLGPALTLTATSAKPATGKGIDATINVQSANLTASLAAGIDEPAIDFKGATVNLKTEPASFAQLAQALAPPAPGSPGMTLVAPAAIALKIEPLRIPMANGAPDLAKAGTLKASVRSDAPILIDGVMLAVGEDQQKRSTGPIGLDKNLVVDLSVPLAALKGGQASDPLNIVVAADLLQGVQPGKLGTINLTANAPLSADGSIPPITAKAQIAQVDTTRLDAILGQPGLVSGAAGNSADVLADAVVKLPQKDGEQPRIEGTLSINSPLAKTTQPAKFVMDAESMGLTDRMILTWTMQPQWGDRQLLGADKPAKPGLKGMIAGKRAEPPVRFSGPSEFTLQIPKLKIAAGQTPLKPDIFALDIIASTPAMNLKPTGDVPVQSLKGFTFRTMSDAKRPGVVGFSVEAKHDGGTPDKPALKVGGGILNVADATGKLTPEAVLINAAGEANDFPIALVDALAQQGGLLLEALGPTGQLTFGAEGLTQSGGVLAGKVRLNASSPRASAQLVGRLEKGAFINNTPAVFTLSQVSRALGQKILPKVGTFEKLIEDGPAKVTITNLRAPVDGDLAKLNGDLVFELGQARFSTDELMGTVLKAIGGKEAGKIGQRIEPFKAQIRNGVMTYEKFSLPLGEFALTTRGSIDLVQQNLDLVTYLPLGSVSDEAAKLFSKGIGSISGNALQATTQLPFRIKGGMGDPKIEPDLKLFAEEAVGNITNDLTKDPGKVIDGLFKKKDKK
jgi:AsmA-like C-terminal region